MDKLQMAIEALKTAREELAKNGTSLTWELIAVNKETKNTWETNQSRNSQPSILESAKELGLLS